MAARKKNLPGPRALFLGLRNGYLWFKIQNLVEKKEFGKALDALGKMYRTKSFKIEIDLMKAQILNDQSRHHECYALANALIGQIESNEKLTADEKRYCIAYSRWLADLNAKEVHPDRSGSTELASDLGNIDLSKVADHWKSNFPLRIHPNWKEVVA